MTGLPGCYGQHQQPQLYLSYLFILSMCMYKKLEVDTTFDQFQDSDANIKMLTNGHHQDKSQNCL